jgi:hypothetical protein
MVVVGLIAGAVGLVRLLETLARRPVFVAGLILAMQLVIVGIDPDLVPIPPISVGGASIYLRDVVFGLVGLAAFVRLLGMKRLSPAQIGIVVAGLLAALAVFRGITEVGVQQAVNEVRPSFYFLSGVFYFMTVIGEKSLLYRIGRLYLIAAGVLCLLVISLWITTLSGAPAPKPLATPHSPGDFRVIGAGFTLILAQGLLISLSGITGSRFAPPLGYLRFLPFLLLAVVILLQHRTLWVAAPLGLLVLAFRQRSTAKKGMVRIIGLAGGTILVLGLVFAGPENRLTISLEKRTDTHTFEWRYEGWVELLEGREAPQGTEVFIGAPYGEGYEREVFGAEEDVSPHNYYLESYLRHGLIGLGGLLIAYALAVGHLAKQRLGRGEGGLADPDVLLALAATQLIFFFTYAPSVEQGILAGLIVGIIGSREPEDIARIAPIPSAARRADLVASLAAKEITPAHEKP